MAMIIILAVSVFLKTNGMINIKNVKAIMNILLILKIWILVNMLVMFIIIMIKN